MTIADREIMTGRKQICNQNDVHDDDKVEFKVVSLCAYCSSSLVLQPSV